MTESMVATQGRRALLKNGLVLAGTLALPRTGSAAKVLSVASVPPVAPLPKVPATPVTSSRVVRPALLRQALAAVERHGSSVRSRDRIGIVDFAAKSADARFHFVDLVSGKSQSLLVAHGSGSDPGHTGYLQRFSNAFGSNASSEGAFVTGDYYVGKHGRSQRLHGMDATNCNALDRAIVVHSAWYANKDVLRTRGVLGRSQGCFAVGEQDLDAVFAQLGVGRLIYASKA